MEEGKASFQGVIKSNNSANNEKSLVSCFSLMSQYTPDFNDGEKHPELARCVTSFEYDSVSKEAIALGFDGFFQSKASATAKYTPDFD